MRKIKFATDQIYHIYNRGVEKRNIFSDESDYLRFIHNLYEFNDTKPALPSNVKFSSRRPGIDIKSDAIKQCLDSGNLNIASRQQLVSIFAFCLMPNHFHLLIQPKQKDGVEKFMLKIGAGYANYFNKKYQRIGGLFQGRFKATLIEKDAHFLHIPNYIHCNPLKLIMPGWKTGGGKRHGSGDEFFRKLSLVEPRRLYRKKKFPFNNPERAVPERLRGKTILSKPAYRVAFSCLDSGNLNIVVINIAWKGKILV